MRRYYQILGVSPNATLEEIKAAWLFSIKAFHPDKFSSSSPQQQRTAHARSEAINEAYSVLSDPIKRSNYDREFARQGRADPASPRPAGAPPPAESASSASSSPGFVFPPLSSGWATDVILSSKVKDRLRERYNRPLQQQFKTAIASRAMWWIVVGGCTLGLCTVLGNARQQRWSSDTSQAIMMLGCGIGIALSVAAFQLIRWYFSPFKRMLYVTPLYVIETQYNELRYWPIWLLSDLSGTNRYYNSIYYQTDVVLTFQGEVRRLRFRGAGLYQQLASTLRVFFEKAASAASQGDKQYFKDEDDFRDVQPTVKQNRKRSLGAGVIGSLTASATVAMAFMTAFNANENAPKPKPVRLGTNPSNRISIPSQRNSFDPSRAIPPPVEVPSSPYVRADDPANGLIFKNQLRNGHGTLKIVNGTRYHAVAKLVSTVTNHSVFTVFVGAEEQYTIKSIPNGSYRLAFAQGRRWNWINDGFDEAGGSSIFRNSLEFDTTNATEGNDIVTYYHTFEVTLQPVAGGTARTDGVAPEVFEKF